METKVVRKRRNAPLKSIQNLPASCRKSCHWPLTSNATSPAGPWPYGKLYPVMKRHHPAWTVPCLDHRPASWVVPEAWTEAWVSRRFFFFKVLVGVFLIDSLERKEVLHHFTESLKRLAPVELHCKTHLCLVDSVMKAGTCTWVQLVQGFNHYCFRYILKSDPVSVSDSENCDFFSSLFLLVPSDELQSSPGSHSSGRAMLVPSCVSLSPVQNQNCGILPQWLCHLHQREGECGVRQSPTLLPGLYMDISFMAAGKDEVTSHWPWGIK